MASTRKDTGDKPKSTTRRRPPAMTPEARENQIINKALNEIERQIEAREASSQILSHYAKLGSTRERLEQERLLREVDLLERKASAMDSAKRIEELYDEAIAAMRSYGGQPEQRHDD
jgi:hypothetical protein